MTEITQLPIYKHQDEINAALAEHSVIVVQGPTGCGKTTQLPRILLRNPQITGRIGLTQPRRIAAVSVANRIAHEIGCTLGEEVGYAIRFDDKTSEETMVKVMTDGILLQESRTDHLYSQYQVIIIDEAHEGTQTELSSIIFNHVIKDKTKLLELSGTPFNLLDQYEDEQVYTWDYVMEQRAKLEWKLAHPDEQKK